MNRRALLIIFMLSLTSELYSHEVWIDATSRGAKNKRSVAIKLCNGHSFPASSFKISKRIIRSFQVVSPDGKITKLRISEREKHLESSYEIKQAGTYVVEGTLKNPPRYFLKSLFSHKRCQKSKLKLGREFEIVPDNCPSILKIGDRLSLKILFNGKPLAASLSVSIDGKTNFHSSSDRQGVYSFTIRRRGYYLVTTAHGGKSCSLTFQIK
jgi:uncharacterized GH25 family protein